MSSWSIDNEFDSGLSINVLVWASLKMHFIHNASDNGDNNGIKCQPKNCNVFSYSLKPDYQFGIEHASKCYYPVCSVHPDPTSNIPLQK